MTGEAVYFMTHGRAQRLPTPPPFHNKGNWIFSLSRLTRWMGERAEELGAFVQPETTALRLLVEKGSVRGVQTAPMGLDRAGKASAGAAPPTEIVAKATVLAEGTQGHLRGVALDHFGVGSRFPQAYEIGVKEVWKVAKPLDRIIHTLGWPLRWSGKYGEVGGSFIYPMGPEHVCVGFVLGLEYTDSGLSPHDILQEFKTHKFVRNLLEGGERVAWGAKTIPSGGYYSMPDTLALPGAVLTGDSAGLVNIPRLKGVHYAMHSGILAAEAIHAALKDGADLTQPDALAGYDGGGQDGPHRPGPAPLPQPSPGALARARHRRPDRRPDGPDARRTSPAAPGASTPMPSTTWSSAAAGRSSPTACSRSTSSRRSS